MRGRATAGILKKMSRGNQEERIIKEGGREALKMRQALYPKRGIF